MKGVLKKLICGIVLVAIAFTIVGCNNKEPEVAKRQIKGVSVETYTETIASLIKGIYAPVSKADFEQVTKLFSEYASPEVTKKFSSVSPNFDSETFNSDFVWKAKKFGDKSYQPNGKDKLYYEFDVIRRYKHYNVAIEFELDGTGTIVNYKVFN